MTRIEQRLVGVEKKQEKLSDTLKEISDLVKTLKKDSFSIKGSNYEVCNFFTIIIVCSEINYFSTVSRHH